MRSRFLTLTLFICGIYFLHGQPSEIDRILDQSRAFSDFMVKGDIERMLSIYTEDAKIFPNNRMILGGEELKGYWQRSPDSDYRVLFHKATPEEIKVFGNEAYDWGYYEGRSISGGEESDWKGKYVIIWKKVGDEWKMYLDIWNRVRD